MTNKRGPYKRKYDIDATERTCRVCKIEKPVDCFAPNTIKDGGYVSIDSRCYDCRKPEKAIIHRMSKYGVSDQEFTLMLKAQDNRCAICKEVFKSSRATHIDHCHDTGKVRGLLCHSCNVGIGHLKDSVMVLQNAIDYLTWK